MGAKKRVTLSLIWVTNVLFELETEPTKKRLQIMFPREMNIHYLYDVHFPTKRQK